MMYSVYERKDNCKLLVQKKSYGYRMCRQYVNSRGREKTTSVRNGKYYDNPEDAQYGLDAYADAMGYKWIGVQSYDDIQCL